MISSRFYRPKMAALTNKEEAFLGSAEDAGLTYLEPDTMMTRYVVSGDHVADVEGRCQVTYKFSMATRDSRFSLRDNVFGRAQYGTPGMSYRVLYEFLCQYFNGGDYFIDTYFEKLFKSRSVHDELLGLNVEIESAIASESGEMQSSLHLKKDGTPDMRYATSKRFMDFKVWQDPIKRTLAARVAEEIKQDIIRCLRSGMIPLRKQTVSQKTLETRQRFIGLEGDKMFYASGKLIEHLSIFVEIGG